MNTSHTHTTDPVKAGDTEIKQPEFIRLPNPGQRCELTGLTRSSLNELVLPTERNAYKPPVRSVSLRRRGSRRGIRLIVAQSLLDYLYSLE